MSRLRVIQWTTGKVGKMALRGISNDPRLELVGVEALLALQADSVVYTPACPAPQPDAGASRRGCFPTPAAWRAAR